MYKFFKITLVSLFGMNMFAQTLDKSTTDETSSPPPQPQVEKKQDSGIKNIWEGLSLSGFAFARHFAIFDDVGNGLSQQYRVKLDLTTGEVKGYRVTAGLFFAQGSSSPDLGASTDLAVQGSRGTAYNDNFADRFNVSQIYGSKEFTLHSGKLKIDIGKMNINSPLNDKTLDLGTGGQINGVQKLNVGQIKYHLSFFDSWMSDHAAYNIRRLITSDTGQENAGSLGIGNNLTMLGVNGKLLNESFTFNIHLANVYQLFDFIGFVDVGYNMSFGDHKLSLLGQAASAIMNSNYTLYLSDLEHRYNNEDTANTRGVYNIQLAYKIHGFQAKLGYLGSFGDGYGVLLTSKSGIDTAGKIWNGNLTATYEGLGAFGSGGFRGSSINVAYLVAAYKFKFPLKISVDVSYVFGNTNMPILNVATTSLVTHNYGYNATNQNGSRNHTQAFANPTFWEIAPQISYNFTKNLEASFFIACILGDMKFNKTKVELKFTF